MSLNSVVNNLVRAAAGIPQDISDSDLDAHVAKLLADEAKAKEKSWSELGLSGLLGESGRGSPDPNAPKPNKRFLASVIRTVDGHNSALLRAQAEAARDVRISRGESSRGASRLFGGALSGMGKERDGGSRSREERRRDRDRERDRERSGEVYRSREERERESRRRYDTRDHLDRHERGDSRSRRRDLDEEEYFNRRSSGRDRGNKEEESSRRHRHRDDDGGDRERERHRDGAEESGLNRRERRRRHREEGHEAEEEEYFNAVEKRGTREEDERYKRMRREQEERDLQRAEREREKRRIKEERASNGGEDDRHSERKRRRSDESEDADDDFDRRRKHDRQDESSRDGATTRRSRRYEDDEEAPSHEGRPVHGQTSKKVPSSSASASVSKKAMESGKAVAEASGASETTLHAMAPRSSKHRRRSSSSPLDLEETSMPMPSLSKMDKYFHTSYDPRLDLGEVPKDGLVAEVGWDNMLAVLKERGQKLLTILADWAEKKRHQSPSLSDDAYNVPKNVSLRTGSPEIDVKYLERAERRKRKEERKKRRGSEGSDDERERRKATQSASTGPGAGASSDLFDIPYVKKGGVREWDVGK